MESENASDIAYIIGLESLAPQIYGGMIGGRRYTLENMPFIKEFELRTGFSPSDPDQSDDFFAACDEKFTSLGLSVKHDAATIYTRVPQTHFNHEVIDSFLLDLDAICRRFDIRDGCFYCGSQDASIAFRKIDSISAYTCESCHAELEHELKSTLEAKNTTFENSKYPKTSMLHIEPRKFKMTNTIFITILVIISIIDIILLIVDRFSALSIALSVLVVILIIYKRVESD